MSETPSRTAEIFSDWVKRDRGIAIKIARSFAVQPEDQRDLLQEMHLQIWRSIERFGAQAKVSTWIYRVCLNTAMTRQRSEKRRRLLLRSIVSPDLLPNDEDIVQDPRLANLTPRSASCGRPIAL